MGRKSEMTQQEMHLKINVPYPEHAENISKVEYN